MSTLSANTQAILLLTAPLLVDRHADRRSSAEPPLTGKEYNRLALELRNLQRQPADLLGQGAEEALRACRSIVDETRARRLLERGLLLSRAVERWSNRAIWVLSRADAAYPRRLKSRLKDLAPPVLYGCGDLELLPAGSSGQLIQIALQPSKGLQVSFDGTNWTSSKLEQSWVSTTTTFTAKLYVRDAS